MMLMNNLEGDKIFFSPGDMVEMKQEIPNKPKMVVMKIERSLIRKENTNPYLRFFWDLARLIEKPLDALWFRLTGR